MEWNMDRRDFLKKASASGLGLALSQPMSAMAARANGKPNILFILLDQMRFPSEFPEGVKSTNQFLAKFMPNTHKLWKRGVKFANHFGASSACSPSRGVMVTGLYNQQTWLLQTLTSGPNAKFSVSPILNPAFPTYGKLLRQAGYQTPYLGKWHLSLMQLQNPLEPYGFTGMTKPDPIGGNLQGAVGDQENGFLSDKNVADQAVEWLGARKASDQRWCLTVGFVNPHDHEFFWGGTEFQTYNDLFNQSTLKPFTFYSTNNGTDYPPVVSWDDNILKNPPSYGYPAVPHNWESAQRLEKHKPSSHSFLRTFSEFVWGGASDDPAQDQFTIAPYPSADLDGYGIAIAPYSYWQRNLDSYTQALEVVDEQIGRVVDALPPDVANETVIVFTSDHGDYVGAHGQLTNKALTGYDEAFHVPLIVVDPTERFAGDIDTIRHNLTSHADLLNLLVSLGHNGNQDWLRGRYAEMYGSRHNMIPMLQSAEAPGRPYILFATDEIVQPQYNYNGSPMHVVCLRTSTEKLVTYTDWRSYSTNSVPSSLQLEFYDYATRRGRAELANTPDDPRVPAMLAQLRDNLIPNELRAPLPQPYRAVSNQARQDYLQFAHLILNPPDGDWSPKIVKKWLGIGYGY
jgi:uncharacterized sulfatase